MSPSPGPGALFRDERAVSALEFALVLPLLVLFGAGTIEVSRLLLLTQKLQSAAFTLADLTARIDGDAVRRSETLGNVFLAIDEVVKPFDFAGGGRAVVTSIASPAADATPTVAWQCAGSGGLAATSAVGVPAETAALPLGLDIRKGETIIAAEVYFEFRPLFGVGLLPERTIRRVAYFKPRLGEIASVACPES